VSETDTDTTGKHCFDILSRDASYDVAIWVAKSGTSVSRKGKRLLKLDRVASYLQLHFAQLDSCTPLFSQSPDTKMELQYAKVELLIALNDRGMLHGTAPPPIKALASDQQVTLRGTDSAWAHISVYQLSTISKVLLLSKAWTRWSPRSIRPEWI